MIAEGKSKATMQCDRGVVGVPDQATDVDARIPPHGAPPSLWPSAAGQGALAMRLGDTVRVPRADVDGFASRPVAGLGAQHLRLADGATGASSAERPCEKT